MSQPASVPREEQNPRSEIDVSDFVTGRSPDGGEQRVDSCFVNESNPLANSTATLEDSPHLRALRNDRSTDAAISVPQPDEVMFHACVPPIASSAHQTSVVCPANHNMPVNSNATLEESPHFHVPHIDRPTDAAISVSQPDEVRIHARVSNTVLSAHQMSVLKAASACTTCTNHPENVASSVTRPGDVNPLEPPALNATIRNDKAVSARQPGLTWLAQQHAPLTTNSASQPGEMSLINLRVPPANYNTSGTCEVNMLPEANANSTMEARLHNPYLPHAYRPEQVARPVEVRFQEPRVMHATYPDGFTSNTAQHNEPMYSSSRAPCGGYQHQTASGNYRSSEVMFTGQTAGHPEQHLQSTQQGYQAASSTLLPDGINPRNSAHRVPTHLRVPCAAATLRTDVTLNADPRAQAYTRNACTSNGALNAQRPSEYPMYPNLSARGAYESRLFLDQRDVHLDRSASNLQNELRRIDERCEQFRIEQRLLLEEQCERFRQEERRRFLQTHHPKPVSGSQSDTRLDKEHMHPWHGFSGQQVINQSQVSAHHCTSRELPSFSGNPKEWSVFIASYDYSNGMCSDEENMLRLQRCLKGKAFDAVESCLYHPSSVPEAIEILRERYGRPALIVKALMSKIRAMPAPKANDFESLADYGYAVRTLCAAMGASGLVEYLNGDA